MSKKVLIIGSGIAGISSSLKLKSYGLHSIIVDKGNFIGGRISTRQVNNETSSYFFHGAQFFTAKTHNFNKVIQTGIKEGYIEEFGNFNPKRFRGNKTMRDFLLNLSKELKIKQSVKITEVKPNNNKINILDDKIKDVKSPELRAALRRLGSPLGNVDDTENPNHAEPNAQRQSD